MTVRYIKVYNSNAIEQLQGVRIPESRQYAEAFDPAMLGGHDWTAEQVQVMP